MINPFASLGPHYIVVGEHRNASIGCSIGGVPVNCSAGWWYTYPSEKYEFVNGKDDIPYMKWKITFMFQSTKQ